MDRPRALVIGGSLSGLFAANLLRTIGWDVAVFERTRGDLAGRGAGLGAQTALFDVMRRIGITLDASMWVDVHSHICLDRGGQIVCQVPLRQISTAWDRVYRALKHALPPECYHAGMVFERFDQTTENVVAVFADGSREHGDLLIGADGIRSAVRRQLMPELQPRYAAYVAWRGVVEESEVPIPLRTMVFNHMVFCFPEGEMAFSVPMANLAHDPRRCNRRCMFVWFRPAHYETTLRQWCIDATGRSHGVAIPPPLIRSEFINDLRLSAETLLAPQITALFGGVRQPILQPIFDLETPRISFGRVVLLGDAAFVARPHVGTGVTKAALDAQALTDALDAANENFAAALARYDTERRQFGSWLVARGRYLGSHLKALVSPYDERAQGYPHQSIESYLREYGAAGVIYGEAISARCA
jgi:2-polyprenyl-6-methoxyphenol hydroxylase-like FAD-dependent oxidoreductase